ncbi:unnamed protein product [Symbiodinium sp. CCMP2456]|nr:unnamed protein product [Symbiodinium sp. CCMP2456]
MKSPKRRCGTKTSAAHAAKTPPRQTKVSAKKLKKEKMRQEKMQAASAAATAGKPRPSALKKKGEPPAESRDAEAPRVSFAQKPPEEVFVGTPPRPTRTRKDEPMNSPRMSLNEAKDILDEMCAADATEDESQEQESSAEASGSAASEEEDHDDDLDDDDNDDAAEGSEEEDDEDQSEELGEGSEEEGPQGSSEPEQDASDEASGEGDGDSSSHDDEPPPPPKKGSKKATRDEVARQPKAPEPAKRKHKHIEKETRGREEEKGGKKKKQKRGSPKREAGQAAHARSKGRGKEKKQKQGSPEREAPRPLKKKAKDRAQQAGPKALQAAEQKLTINSNSHHTEYLRYKRWERFPKELGARILDEDSRMRLFADYVEAKGNVSKILLMHQQQLVEQQRSKIRYGFRGEKWVRDTHGDLKGEKIMARKKAQGLKTIADPESPEDSLYFVFVEINIDDIRDLQRITKLEITGTIDDEMLKAFTEAGGVLDPTKQLALGTGVPADTMAKALQTAGGIASAAGKPKPSKKANDASKANKAGYQRKSKPNQF